MDAGSVDAWHVPTLDVALRIDYCRAQHLPVLREYFGLLQALARVPAWDTPQVRPCRLLRGIHAA
ncbi:hypothetical protein [Xanthomonas hortorum]|uniref:Uncharacterized protein n=1 Tax=Xanthomonas hortorum pv. hederae TaxID=453603 RepID=A0A9X4H7I4_9XANT|nr:hypothetical protein [Xanthomonas hortorum]MCE4372166.1 hypothetical protein [Xanthomonas hortorum pv. hederae]MDC8639116.1 hypothetical protein [Xanthomonas hortorum pv. hederae]